MARDTATFKQADVTRALKAAVAAGIEVARVEIEARTGNIIISTPHRRDEPDSPYDVWKAENNAG
jgi:hypothetical protein